VIAAESAALQHNLNQSRHVDYRTGASSVINIAVHPGWGRVPETYGECPLLTGDVALALNKGLMGYAAYRADDPDASRLQYGRMVVLPTLRHFAAYAGPERNRFGFSATVPEMMLRYTFLPAWRRLVRAGAVGGVMSAITAVNGVPSAADGRLLTGVLRGEWGYDGHVISDCDTLPAMSDPKLMHYTAGTEQAAAAALAAGGDINCGPQYAALLNASEDGLVSSALLDRALRRALRGRFRVGGFDLEPPTDPFFHQPLSVIDSAEHQAVLRRMVRESVVLLRNAPTPSKPAAGGGKSTLSPAAAAAAVAAPMLPLRLPAAAAGGSFRIALIGPTADDIRVQAHTYHGTPKRWVTIAAALNATLAERGLPSALTVVGGCARFGSNTAGYAAAVAAARAADAVLYVGGLDASVEEEDTDRSDLALPSVQLGLIAALRATGKPLAAVLVSGGAVASPALVEDLGTATGGSAQVDALLWMSYFGESAQGLVDVLLGDYDPSGRLPFTIPRSMDDCNAVTEYDLALGNGSTYRYLNFSSAPPLFPFGAGLSYTAAAWAPALRLKAKAGVTAPPAAREGPGSAANVPTGTAAATGSAGFRAFFGSNLTVTATLSLPVGAAASGASALDLDVAVQLYAAFDDGSSSAGIIPASLPPYVPRRQLVGLRKVTLSPGKPAKDVQFDLALDEEGLPGLARGPLPGFVRLWVGDADPANARSSAVLEVVLRSQSHEL
jgi:beta-glucosidase